MQTENLIFNNSCKRQIVEKVCEELPYVCVAILAHTFVVETINLSDLSAFVVASENGDSLSVAHF